MNNFNDIFNSPDHTSEYDYSEIETTNPILMALTYIPVLFFLPLVVKPVNAYGKFHANQSLIFLILCVGLTIVSSILCTILGFIPLINAFMPWIIKTLCNLIIFAYMVFGMINAYNKQAKELPIIGGFKIIK